MLYVMGHWIDGNKEVKYAKSILHVDTSEILTALYNWPDTNDTNVEIESYDEEHFVVCGKIEDLLVFIYRYILNIKNCTLSDIISNSKELQENAEIYLDKTW